MHQLLARSGLHSVRFFTPEFFVTPQLLETVISTRILDNHFQHLSELLDLESVAEMQRMAERRKRQNSSNAERSGETLLDLVIDDAETGLGGRVLLTLIKRNRTQQLPWNRLRIGTPVVVSHDVDGGEAAQGVVSGRQQNSIQVAVDDWIDWGRIRLDLSPDEITRKRQQAALRVAEKATGRTGVLRSVLLNERELKFAPERDYQFSASLNPSQQAAIRFALSAEDVAIIHGPPGTGKTTTVVELICQAIAQGQKVLACAPSNTAVDNLLERLVAARQNVVRIGHPARVAAELRDLTLDAQVEQHPIQEVVADMRREIEQLFRQANRYTRAKPTRGFKQDLRSEARELKSQIRTIERQAVNDVIDRADVICATSTFDDDALRDRRFDLVVIDEACQATEPGSWLPLLRAERIILAGDHCQLPPTVLSDEAAKKGLALSLLERLIQSYGDSINRRLEVQYRMHEQIMQFSSQQFYDGALTAHDTVKTHLLCDLAGVAETTLTIEPVTFIDTAGAGWEEELEPDGLSRRNLEEGRLVIRKVRELAEAGLSTRDIAVIAPYAAQVRWLREQWGFEDLEIDTVDGFQGREKEAVVISLVRSNSEGEIGFLADTRRMNVALTRARRKLIVIGDSSTLGGNDFYSRLFEYFESIGAYHTVWEEVDA